MVLGRIICGRSVKWWDEKLRELVKVVELFVQGKANDRVGI